MTGTSKALPKKSPARERLLGAATEAFYSKGIHSVGIEEIVERSNITRSTLYRHFPGKDDLVVAYLEAASSFEREQLEPIAFSAISCAAAVRAVAQAIAEQIMNPAFRGCAFLNAAAEYPDPAHPVRQAIQNHRTWFANLIAAIFRKGFDRQGDAFAHHFILLRDGAMAAGCLADPARVSALFLEAVERVLESARAD